MRDFASVESNKYRSRDLSANENDELGYAIKSEARKWALRIHDALPLAVRTTVARGLEMRLDGIDKAYEAQLVKVIKECAIGKLQEFQQDRGAGVTAMV